MGKASGLASVLAAFVLWTAASPGAEPGKPAAPAPLPAEVTLPSVFGSNMVLQRDMAVPIWGTSVPGDEIVVKIAGQEVKGKADEKGQWMVRLAAMKAGGPHEMTVSGKSTVTFKNVLVGDVWLCAGQSNMQPELHGNPVTKDELAKLNEIRQLRGNQWWVCKWSEVCGFNTIGFHFAREVQDSVHVPIGLMVVARGATGIQHFMPPAGNEGPEGQGKKPGGGLFEQEVRPLVPYGIRGVLWYQGESNVGDPNYTKYFEKLVGGWRKAWGQPPPLSSGAPGGDFPFYFVQLAPYDYVKNMRKEVDALPRMWECQTRALAIPNTGMAVNTDAGEPNNIHPGNKKVVGHRLALLALTRTYGNDKLVCSGPLYKSMAAKDGKIRIEFDHVGGGLVARDGKPLDFFEIAGADKKFVPAKAEIDGTGVVVSAEGLANPVAVRFGWRDTASPNLTNKEGLPASPFRTDSW